MDFGFSAEQDLLRSTARDALARLFPSGWQRPLLDAPLDDLGAGVPPWERVARLGWFGIGVPEERGGAGGSSANRSGRERRPCLARGAGSRRRPAPRS